MIFRENLTKMNRTTTLEVLNNSYTVDYPNTGNQIDIELLKAKISDGNYDTLRFSSNPLFQAQADVIDMIATFSVLVPQLKEDMNVKSFFELQEEETDVLMKVYTEQFIPWFIKIKTTIRKPKREEVVLKDQIEE